MIEEKKVKNELVDHYYYLLFFQWGTNFIYLFFFIDM